MWEKNIAFYTAGTNPQAPSVHRSQQENSAQGNNQWLTAPLKAHTIQTETQHLRPYRAYAWDTLRIPRLSAECTTGVIQHLPSQATEKLSVEQAKLET